jgi:hypothetical protein
MVTAGVARRSPRWAAQIAIGNQMAGHPLGFSTPNLDAIGNSEQAKTIFATSPAAKHG